MQFGELLRKRQPETGAPVRQFRPVPHLAERLQCARDILGSDPDARIRNDDHDISMLNLNLFVRNTHTLEKESHVICVAPFQNLLAPTNVCMLSSSTMSVLSVHTCTIYRPSRKKKSWLPSNNSWQTIGSILPKESRSTTLTMARNSVMLIWTFSARKFACVERILCHMRRHRIRMLNACGVFC